MGLFIWICHFFLFLGRTAIFNVFFGPLDFLIDGVRLAVVFPKFFKDVDYSIMLYLSRLRRHSVISTSYEGSANFSR